MATDIYTGNLRCCHLVGNYPTTLDGIISMNTRTNVEVSKVEECTIVGPATGSVSISAYADDKVHSGCAVSANVSIPWIRKYDCDYDVSYFIFSGAGQASIAGDISDIANLVKLNDIICTTPHVSASASSGPMSLYQKSDQHNGSGLTYNGHPWHFNTEVESTLDIKFDDFPSMFLQSFSLQCTPGQVPTASFEFVYSINTR